MRKHYITKVTSNRWKEALEWERAGWVAKERKNAKCCRNIIWELLSVVGLKPKYRGDDWNHWWKKQFRNYDFLPSGVENAIELGCGPYTNVRLMIETITPRHLVLSDPLIRTYVNFRLSFVSQMYRKGLCIIDDHPIEKCAFAPDYFDVTVMINVLDHVQDAELCMMNARNIVKPGGILIIGQDLTNEVDMCPAGATAHLR